MGQQVRLLGIRVDPFLGNALKIITQSPIEASAERTSVIPAADCAIGLHSEQNLAWHAQIPRPSAVTASNKPRRHNNLHSVYLHLSVRTLCPIA